MRGHELRKEAVTDNLPLFLSFVDIVCTNSRVGEASCAALKLAVEEACQNIIMHGYAGTSGTITLSAQREGDHLVLTIADEGKPFHPDSASPPDLSSDWQTRQPGGLGWHLIRQSVDDLSYESAAGQNRLTLVKNLEEV